MIIPIILSPKPAPICVKISPCPSLLNSVSQSQPVIKTSPVETCTATNLKSQDYLTCKNAWGETTHQMLNYRTILFIFSYIPDKHHKCRQEKDQC